MSGDVKLRGQLPGSTEKNGMYSVQADLLKDGMAQRLAVIVYDAPWEKIDHESEERTPTMRVLRIEPLGDVDDPETEDLQERLLRAAEARTGATRLPFDQVDPSDDAGDDQGDDDAPQLVP